VPSVLTFLKFADGGKTFHVVSRLNLVYSTSHILLLIRFI